MAKKARFDFVEMKKAGKAGIDMILVGDAI